MYVQIAVVMSTIQIITLVYGDNSCNRDHGIDYIVILFLQYILKCDSKPWIAKKMSKGTEYSTILCGNQELLRC